MANGVNVRIRKGSTVFNVHGDNAGKQGVWLAHGQVQGLYDAPVRTTWKTGAFQIGSTQKSRKWLHRDLTLGFHIKDTYSSYEFNESLFRQVFEYEPDPWDASWSPTVIEVDTALSGTRYLDVLMYEAPDFDSDIDPLQQGYGNLILKLRAGDPFWYSDTYSSTFSAVSGSGSGFVTVSNPTDQICYQKWLLSRGTWTLPDFRWQGAQGYRLPAGARFVDNIVVGEANGAAVVDLDRQELMFRDARNTNILAQLSGKFFEYPIPPYTPLQQIPVSFVGAPAGGASVTLQQPRRWSRPWGMELAKDAKDIYSGSQSNGFVGGSYTYTIPNGTTHIDVVLIGGGGGGGGGTLFPGNGGGPGGWYTTTLVRGVDIPATANKITGYVGSGGRGGDRGNISNGSVGSATTARCGNWQGVGPGGVGSANNFTYGLTAPTITFKGRQYAGGAGGNFPGVAGSAPGGGGAGGKILGDGAAGGRGQAFFYAYQVS